MTRKSWVQDPHTGKLIPKDEYVRQDTRSAYVQGDIENFVSPIDGSVISDRGQLRRHMDTHQVTDSRDYSSSFIEKRAKERVDRMCGRTKEARAERLNLMRRELDR